MISCRIRLIYSSRRAVSILDDFPALLNIVLRNFVGYWLITLFTVQYNLCKNMYQLIRIVANISIKISVGT